MCGLMQPAVDMAANKAAKAARDIALKEGKETAMLSSIRNLMKNMKWSAQKAMDVLEIPQDEQSKYAALI